MKSKFLFILIGFLGIYGFAQKNTVFTGVDSSDFKRLGLQPNKVELWEDGMRTSGKVGTYEWWYFDMMLEDKSKLVIVFYTKSLAETVFSGIKPVITIMHTAADGSLLLRKTHTWKNNDYEMAKEQCKVRFGNNYCKGDLNQYLVHLDIDGVKAEIQLQSEVPAWRPATGHIYFGEKRKHYFAWLPSVPKGKVSGVMSYNGKNFNLSGSGYHDHNWGNKVLSDVLNHWYWTRTEMGEYTVIASQIYASKKYKYQEVPVFFVAKGNKVVAENGANMKFIGKETVPTPKGKKLISQDVAFDYQDKNQQYVLHLKQKEYIEKSTYQELTDGWVKRMLKITGFNPSYFRMTGEVSLKIKTPEFEAVKSGDGIWEMFYLGENMGK